MEMGNLINRARRNTLGDLLTRSRLRYPTKLAFTYKERTVTYKELDDFVNKTANAFKERGMQKGDMIGVLSKNNLDFVIVNFALAKLGAVFIPINYMLGKKDIKYILHHAKVDGLVTTEDNIELFDAAADGLNIKHRYILEWSGTEIVSTWEPLSVIQQSASNLPVESDINDDDLAHVLYTSGTESAPKGVMLSHKSIISEYVSAIVDGKMAKEDVLVHALPLYHSAQLHVFLGPSIYLGSSGIILDEATPTNIMETIEEHQASQLFAPPTVWIAILRDANFQPERLASLRKCYYGAAIMPKEILRELAEKLPNAGFWNFYGQTEVAPLATALQPEDQLRKLGSAGIATLNVETKIVDDNGVEVPRGEIGEIVHRTPHAMLGYLNNPEKTAEAFKNGWFHSGDLGTMDEEGYITIVDRKKDIIISGGINVASREVEEVIYQLNEVAEVAVIGISDEYWIEKVTAVIVLKDGLAISDEQVIKFCEQELAKFKAPKAVFFTDSLPKNPSGKILKRELRLTYENADK